MTSENEGLETPHKTHLVLRKGSEVEVSSDEDGFRGSWYKATILETPSPKSKKKKQPFLLVQYKTLFNEDQNTPLKEYATPSHVRPLPPEEESGKWVFEENEVVDANHADGWWVGVVRKVLEGCNKYLVYFDVPPDLLEFCGDDLRPHWDWDGEKWIRASKQPTSDSIYRSGTSVEVNIENKSVSDAWFPAHVIKEFGDDTFYVKYQSPKNGDEEAGVMKAVVTSTHIRPVPPLFVERDYELLEIVDIRYESGWRSGTITKVLAGRRYAVSLNQGPESKELDHSELRPHVDWVNGKWISKSEKELVVSDNGEQLQGGLNGIANKAGAVKDTIGGKTPSSKGIKLIVKSANGDEKLSSITLPIITRKKTKLAADDNTQTSPPENLTGGSSVQSPLSSVEPSTNEILSNLSTACKRRRSIKKIDDVDQNSVVTAKLTARKRMRTKQHKHVEMESDKLEAMPKKGRHAKSPSKSPEASVTVKEKKAVDAAHQDTSKNVDDHVAGDKTSEVSEGDNTKETDMAIIGVSKDVVDDDNQPLSMWFGFPCGKSASGGCNAKEKQIDLVAKGDGIPQQNHCLTFIKKSPVWKIVESMEVFQRVPQKPHFEPLAEEKEEVREGMAIGYMVILAGLFDKITSLEFDGSRSQFESIIESLLDLEKHGFDVTVPLNRVNELLSIKDRQGELLEKSQSAEKELTELSDEKLELIEKINEIEKKISKLKEELFASQSKMESKELQISTLQLSVDAVNATIDKVRREFEKLAAAPWSSS